jgi:hypothetical protein
MPVHLSAQQMHCFTTPSFASARTPEIIQCIQVTTWHCYLIRHSVGHQYLVVTQAHPGVLPEQLHQHDYPFV